MSNCKIYSCGTENPNANRTCPCSVVTNFSLGGSDIVQIYNNLKPVLDKSISQSSTIPEANLINSIASLAQGKTYSNQPELDALVDYVSKNVAKKIIDETILSDTTSASPSSSTAILAGGAVGIGLGLLTTQGLSQSQNNSPPPPPPSPQPETAQQFGNSIVSGFESIGSAF